ncbi:Zinc finger FYVE domain-containing protein 1 [Lamellibrachia satsuma]|nr:Zinc finger FYVE domain-containing protein 1 [Lamellibrachia satsuma]
MSCQWFTQFYENQVLNKKFSGKIEQLVPSTFPDQYFTCTACCLACGGRCKQTVNHEEDDVPHNVENHCQYKHSLDNKVYTCRACYDRGRMTVACYDRGRMTVVVPKAAAASDSTIFGLAKFAWAGYVLECPHCGIIYRSRQYWYGNQDPDKAAVRTETRHVWPGGNPTLQGTHNAARRLLDGIQYVSGNIASMSAKPAAVVSHWVTDQIAPPYWVPNNQITRCRKCESEFDVTVAIHHCRACGEGFCDECSLKRRKVPERGWGNELVRVCDGCYESRKNSEEGNGSKEPREVTARKVGEVISSTVGSVASVVSYPIVKTVPDLLLDSTRPTYWVPDDEIFTCHVCHQSFGVKVTKHHCRACGQGVCDECSGYIRAVPSRGWDHPVRANVLGISEQIEVRAHGPRAVAAGEHVITHHEVLVHLHKRKETAVVGCETQVVEIPVLMGSSGLERTLF